MTLPSGEAERTDAAVQEDSVHILQDLINAMFVEDLFGLAEKGRLLDEPVAWEGDLKQGESWYEYRVSTDQQIRFRVVRSPIRKQLEFSRLPVLLIEKDRVTQIDAVELLRLLLQQKGPFPNGEGFLNELQLAVQHQGLAQKAWQQFKESSPRPWSFLWTERLASMRDRPFHPTARAKTGWTDEDYQTYSPEFGQSFGLSWIAVRRDHIRTGGEGDRMDTLLSPPDTDHLVAEEMRRKGISREHWVPVPLHPWQSDHILGSLFKQEIQQGIILPLLDDIGSYHATSSLRTLIPESTETVHLKLSLGVGSLSALRILPPRYLENGSKAQATMTEILRKDPVLQLLVQLCDERDWCAFHSSRDDLFEDRPGHLAAQIRRYPEGLLNGSEVFPVPMSALAVQGSIYRLGLPIHDRTSVLRLFRSICDGLIRMVLRFASWGVMPEVHGQNVLWIFRQGVPEKMVLRDHDTLRIYPPWMKAAGIQPPQYTVKPGTPNTLILPDPEALLAYFQTLGIQVNLFAIADAWSRDWEIEEEVFWREIRESIERVIDKEAFSVSEFFRDILLHTETWPFKTILTPLIQREGTGGGSMPSGMGSIPNPLTSAVIRQERSGR
ncbi:IucA/IucC family protein [Melghirimyces algeriensis]|uniref:Siderophore synthetase component n=1 Tax=Melghirimyces algeriensis TaxID=910412 RepID=A0A521F295_9BACL|nr:IucA/IucC family protein [Melghirimyces algeriensis]SMO90293.1 Siderophore synthetase component [Melghirimyces algeriensis]